MFNITDLWPKVSLLAIFTILFISTALFGRDAVAAHWNGWRNGVSLLCFVLLLLCVVGSVVLVVAGLVGLATWMAIGISVVFCILVLYRMSQDDDEVLW